MEGEREEGGLLGEEEGRGKWGFPFLLKHLHPISTCPEPEH